MLVSGAWSDARRRARSSIGRFSRARSRDSFKKLDPRWQARNPVMFVVEVGAAATTIFFVRDLLRHSGSPGFDFAIAAWLWFTVLFANFAEAVAEGRGKAQAETLRRTKSDTYARSAARRRYRGARREHELAKGRPLRRRGGRDRSRRRRRARRRRNDRRVGDHRRIGTGHSRIRRRSQRGYRRHARALRSYRRARNGKSRRKLPRSHDSLGRGRAAAEDPQRDRALDSARRA